MPSPRNSSVPGPGIAPFGHGVTLVVHRRGVNAFGDHTDLSTHTITGCALSQRVTVEDVAGGRRDTVITGLRVHAPSGSDITATDVFVTPDGTRWQVDGQINDVVSPFTGWSPGMTFDATRTTG